LLVVPSGGYKWSINPIHQSIPHLQSPLNRESIVATAVKTVYSAAEEFLDAIRILVAGINIISKFKSLNLSTIPCLLFCRYRYSR
jgi:hypothetical protein